MEPVNKDDDKGTDDKAPPEAKVDSKRVKVTDKDSEEYEAERLQRLDRYAKNVKDPVKHKWVTPKLNPDGSLTEEERGKVKAAKAGEPDAWGGEATRND